MRQQGGCESCWVKLSGRKEENQKISNHRLEVSKRRGIGQMKKLKKLGAFIVLLLLAVSLVACSTKEEKKEQDRKSVV